MPSKSERRLSKLLLVDDEPTDLLLLERSFRKANPHLEIEICKGSDDALDRIINDETDLVLLDINMPGLNGFEVLEATREHRPGGFPPVIMLSSSQNPDDMSRAYATGANAYIVKPTSMDGFDALARAITDFWGGQVIGAPA